MAAGKKSFILYSDLLDKIDMLTIEERGILFTHLLEYVNDKEPVLTDRLLLTAWKPIELELKRDLKKYEVAKENKVNGGRLGNLKRWNTDLYEEVVSENMTLEEAEVIANGRKVSHSDGKVTLPIASVAVNDNVNVNDINNILLSEIKISDDLNENEFFKIAEPFRKLFIKNRTQQGIKTHSNLEKAKFFKWTNEIRLMIEKDKVTTDQLRDIYYFLDSNTQEAKFWKPNIQSIEKLREQFDKLIFAMNKDKDKQKIVKKQNAFTA